MAENSDNFGKIPKISWFYSHSIATLKNLTYSMAGYKLEFLMCIRCVTYCGN